MMNKNKLIEKAEKIFREEGIDVSEEDINEVVEGMIYFWETMLEDYKS